MNEFNKYLFTKDKLIRRRIEIDSSLYEQLEQLVDKYDASINKMVNVAIIEMISAENLQIYKKLDNEISEIRNFAIRESSYMELEKLKEKYGLPICRLINIAIYNALNSCKSI